MAGPRRNLQVDVLRGVAILLVLICHTVVFKSPGWYDGVLVRAGWSGVDLFFVVSGFLISGLLFSEYRKSGRIRFRRFAMRRALKIYPSFYALVLLTVAWSLSRHPLDFSDTIWKKVLHDVLFVQSYFEGTWVHFWSLSVEEHFYIALPLILFWMMHRAPPGTADPFSAIPRIFFVLAPVVLVLRLLTARFVTPFAWQTHLFPTHLRLDSLLFGVVLGYYYHFHQEKMARFVLANRAPIFLAAAVCLAPLTFVGQYEQWMYTYGFTLLYLGYGCLLIGCLYTPLDSMPAPVLAVMRVVGYIGTFSYSIYLWHVFWIYLMRIGGGLQIPIVSLVLYYAGALGLGIATAKIIEFPVLRLRDRLFPRTVDTESIAPSEERVAALTQA